MKSKEEPDSFVLRTSRLRMLLPPIGFLMCRLAAAQTAVISVNPDADAFVRSAAPTSNYGSAGALSVSGAAAVNSSGQQNGLFDALIRFPMSNAVSFLDAQLGRGSWTVAGARLTVNEVASPDNSIFNQGVGAFDVRWTASDNWIEGTGKPKAPTTDGVTWSDLPGIVNSNLDVSLGIFTNAGFDGPIAFALRPANSFVADVTQGGEVDLHLTAVTPEIGFTFNSKDFGVTNEQPSLEITGLLSPLIGGIALTNGFVAVSFSMVSNWTYRLQWTGGLTPMGTNAWSDLYVIPAQSNSGNVICQDTGTNRQRFYRLLVSP